MKILVFGGTYDPIHIGHLLSAESLCEILEPDLVLFVPSAVSPHKNSVRTSFENRFKMLELALESFPKFRASNIEQTLGGISYTYQTLEKLHENYPQAKLFWAIGEDNAKSFDRWKNPDKILELAEVVVMSRSDSSNSQNENLKFYKTRLVDVSSTEIRERVKAGKSIRFLIPPKVEEFIQAKGLYQ
ncbi:MAG: nicotinate (nicotinamide) nucleotide adenylyltransferase [Calditrichaeota bacterium]|nr:MAG: nicotinate (nicotinamide) nucleotide adenylyltransferase [Calditrichota bacterium]